MIAAQPLDLYGSEAVFCCEPGGASRGVAGTGHMIKITLNENGKSD